MSKRFFGVVLVLFLAMCTASAGIVFHTNGECIEGRLIDTAPASNKITVKTIYGEEEFDQPQIITSVDHFSAKRARYCLKSTRHWLRKYNLNKANSEFETLLTIDEKFQLLIDIYKAEYFAKLAKFSVK